MQIIMSSSWALIYATWLNLAHLSKFPEFMMSKMRSSSWNFIYIFPLITNCMWVFGCIHAKVCTIFLTDYFPSPWQHLVYTEHSLKVSSHCCYPASVCGGQVGGRTNILLSDYVLSLTACPSLPLLHPSLPQWLPQHLGELRETEQSLNF